MKEIHIEFKSVKELVNWLIDNENIELFDHYGRVWKYHNLSFYFKDNQIISFADIDIGEEDFKEGIEYLHLYLTLFYYKDNNYKLVYFQNKLKKWYKRDISRN